MQHFIDTQLGYIIRLFYPNYEGSNPQINYSHSTDNNAITMTIFIDGKSQIFISEQLPNPIEKLVYKRFVIRFLTSMLYEALQGHSGAQLPWGSLTGVRPTKLIYEQLNGGKSMQEALEVMANTHHVLPHKLDLLERIIPAQKLAMTTSERYVNLYINIPFCTTRCSYCSFVTTTIDKERQYVDQYIDCLIEEIKRDIASIDQHNLIVKSIYIGGGTPTSLGDCQLDRLLAAIPYRDIEYTCEAGRADTITDSKLRIMQHHGVNRISINPQTMNNTTLVSIGRNHTAEQFLDCYQLARQYPFVINVDLIAGLYGETLDDFALTLNQILPLEPDNITVHTLSHKNGTQYVNQSHSDNDSVSQMMNLAQQRIIDKVYNPYYIYRQKSQRGNLENVGYSKPNLECYNNITCMEETVTIIACGAGGISKRVSHSPSQIHRYANLMQVAMYIDQFEERYDSKSKFMYCATKI